ncbi:uncharacterized protein LOC128232426 [Mya arenaria]|uniref:uncharacterized protein LOC128232426 n=1 Tax=Mya arenaria TaxID=6604 RepID=UPI0022E3DD3A|nr:uncharacterized protein LOC128232426 [Mya arenaria]
MFKRLSKRKSKEEELKTKLQEESEGHDQSDWTIGDCFANYNEKYGNVDDKGSNSVANQKGRKDSDYEVPLNSGEVILYLFGGFNPVHTQHIQSMVESKKWLEENTNFKVIASYLTLSSDIMIKNKCSKDTDPLIMKFEHRRKLCEIACQDIDWLKVHPKVSQSQGEVREVLKADLKKPRARCAVVFGTDRFIKPNSKGEIALTRSRDVDTWFAVCVGREGMPDSVVHWLHHHSSDNSPINGYYLVPTTLPNISSTEIRKKLKFLKESKHEADKARILREMTTSNWITDMEADYIYQHFTDLF